MHEKKDFDFWFYFWNKKVMHEKDICFFLSLFFLKMKNMMHDLWKDNTYMYICIIYIYIFEAFGQNGNIFLVCKKENEMKTFTW